MTWDVARFRPFAAADIIAEGYTHSFRAQKKKKKVTDRQTIRRNQSLVP